MPKLSTITTLLLHPTDLRAIISFYLYRDPLTSIEDIPEESGWNRTSMRRCWKLLDLTSRSFAMVIKELEGELGRVICLFYLILRGLDTIEDDMTIPTEKKYTLLVDFHQRLDEDGWTFTENGPNEKDRQLLVEFNTVIEEFKRLDDHYKNAIRDVTQKMGYGMATYARLSSNNSGKFSVDTTASFDLYCHYVAGLVGEGLSRLFAASGKESSDLGERLELSNSMGLFLQKTNILRDFREDVDQGRVFWPKEVWSKYVSSPEQLYDLENRSKEARYALSDMTVDALQHATDALDYLRSLRNQSVFNFCAIPQVMAIATLDLCYGNLEVYKRNIKLRKGATVGLIMKSTNPRDVAYIFKHYMRRIQSRKLPDDPNFVKLGVLVGRIDQWCETHYPSYITYTGPNLSDRRATQLTSSQTQTAIDAAPHREGRAAGGGEEAGRGVDKGEEVKFMAIVVTFLFAIVGLCIGITYGVVWYFDWLGGEGVGVGEGVAAGAGAGAGAGGEGVLEGIARKVMGKVEL